MRSANTEQQLSKLAEKVKAAMPSQTPAAVKVVKKTPPSATVIEVQSASQQSGDDEDRVFKCDQEGCFSSFKTRSSLRDHHKGELFALPAEN
jgi:hypothetical protein